MSIVGFKVLKFDGAFAPKVLRFDGAFGAEGCGGGFAASKKGARLTAAGCVEGLWFALLKGKVSPLRGDEYEDSVTGLPSRLPPSS